MNSADFANMRRHMVDSQLRTSGVTEAWVLAAMGSVAREDFVPEAARATAYTDRAIPLADGSILNPPEATGLMLQAAQVSGNDIVLLVGADGYVAGLLRERAAQVTVIGKIDELNADGFSLVFIDGAVEELPSALVAAVTEGGRIVTGLNHGSVASLAIGIVRNGRTALRSFGDAGIATLPEFARKAEFVF